jgi:mono/diheme cytochrome c family protein
MMSCANSLFSMPRAVRLSVQSLFVCGLTLWTLGCGTGPQAEFKFRESTEDLVNPAKVAAKDTLKDRFGTPSALVAWERFPVAYGGVKGSVVSVADDKATVVVALDDDAAKVAKGAPIVWMTGSNAGQKSANEVVTSFNKETKQLGSSSSLSTPVVGDRFVIGFGHDLQLGRVVYMKNCMHCHGVTGDGEGPTARYLNPLPRDYRNGQFKFTSTRSGEKATRDDLHRIVKYGIPGTYMPSFLLLGDHETTAVIEYIRWLAIRGEFEKRMVADLSSDFSVTSIADSTAKAAAAFNEKKKNNEPADQPMSQAKAIKAAGTAFSKFAKEELEPLIDETANLLAEAWSRAQEPETMVVPSVQRVADTPESRERGRLLYMSDKTKCYTCHGMTGRGDGAAIEDFWPKPGTNEKYPNRGLHDEWGKPLKPRNLTLGQYRGGRRPVDLFRRMYAGIKGTPMPAFGGTALKDPEIWDLVNYVMSLPYQSRPPAQAASTAGPTTTTGSVAKLEEKSAP